MWPVGKWPMVDFTDCQRCDGRLGKNPSRSNTRINLVFSIWVYQYQTLNEFANCIEVVYDLKCWISSKIMFMKFKMAAGRPFCSSVVFRLIRSQVHISSWITLILSIRGYDLKTLNEFENHRAQIQNGRPAAILFFSVDTRSSPHFFTNQPHIWYMGISIPNAERVRKPPWSDSKWPPGGHLGDFGDDVSAQKFSFFQIVSISCIEVAYDLKCWITSKSMFMKFKMAARQPFCFCRLIRS